MVLQTRILHFYRDSVTLMLAARGLRGLAGVADAAVVMGTPANREILAGAAMLTPEAAAAGPDDLVVVVAAQDEASAGRALAAAEGFMTEAAARGPATAGARRARSLATAIATHPDANLAVISVAGRYAAREARTALAHGLHVMLFSDNVPLAEEIELKKLATARGLLCMGPDAGTAIIDGVALGFANAVPRGPVGLVSAAGTGLQAVTCGLARAGVGVSQAIGTGGRDLSAAVGGATMLAGLAALQADPGTSTIVLISKPPAASVAAKVLAQVACSSKPVVVCFLGAPPTAVEAVGAQAATTLAQAAVLAAALARGEDPRPALAARERATARLIPLAAAERARLAPGQRALRGLFVGGTFCYEAQVVLSGLPEPILSNAALDAAHRMADSQASRGHTCVDLGEDEFTQGRLHPMIDPDLRNRRILQESHDPETAVILLDLVLGYGAHPDPAGAVLPAIREAQANAAAAGRHLVFIASVCGTEADPQRLGRQEAALRDAGVVVLEDNAAAARLAGLITQAGDLA